MNFQITRSYAPVLTSRPWTVLILLPLMYQQMCPHISPGLKPSVTLRPNADNGEVVGVKSWMTLELWYISTHIFTSWPIAFVFEFTMNTIHMPHHIVSPSKSLTTALVSAPIVESSGMGLLCVLIETILTLEGSDTFFDRTYERPVSHVFRLMVHEILFESTFIVTVWVIADKPLFV